MFCFILWHMSIVISRSKSLKSLFHANQECRNSCKHQMELGRQGAHSSTLLCCLMSQDMELELTEVKRLVQSHNLVIINRCLNTSRRVHTLDMEHVIWTLDRHRWSYLRWPLGSSDHCSLWGETSGLGLALSWASQHTCLSDSLLMVGFFQTLYLRQMALPQDFSTFKQWRLRPKLKSSLFQHRMSQRSSCRVTYCHRTSHYHNSNQMVKLCLYYWNSYSYHRSAEILQPKLALDRNILCLQRFPFKCHNK